MRQDKRKPSEERSKSVTEAQRRATLVHKRDSLLASVRDGAGQDGTLRRIAKGQFDDRDGVIRGLAALASAELAIAEMDAENPPDED